MNSATQTVIMHISNDQNYYNDVQEIFERCGDSYDTCVELKEMVDNIMFPSADIQAQNMDLFFRQDIIMDALSQVNWREVYEALAEAV
jgi:hypothetical protein